MNIRCWYLSPYVCLDTHGWEDKWKIKERRKGWGKRGWEIRGNRVRKLETRKIKETNYKGEGEVEWKRNIWTNEREIGVTYFYLIIFFFEIEIGVTWLRR